MALEERDQPATDVVLQGPEDGPVRLADLWKDRRAVFVFLRHFG